MARVRIEPSKRVSRSDPKPQPRDAANSRIRMCCSMTGMNTVSMELCTLPNLGGFWRGTSLSPRQSVFRACSQISRVVSGDADIQ